MNTDDPLWHALVRIATLQREHVDRVALKEAIDGASDAASRVRLATVAEHLGLPAPVWLDAPDASQVPALAWHAVDGWAVVVGRDAQSRWIAARWDPGTASWQESALSALDGWSLARLRLSVPFAVGRSPTFELAAAEVLRHRRALFDAALGGLIVGIIGLVTSLYSMQIYNRVIPTGALQTLAVLTGGALVATGLDWLARRSRSQLYERLIEAVDQRLARAVFLRLLAVRLDQMPASVGSLAAQMRGYETVRSFLAQGTGTLLVDVPFALLFLVCIGWIGGRLALIPLVFFMLAALVAVLIRGRMEAAGREGARAANFKTGLLVETLEGAETIKSGQGGWRMLSRWLDTTAQARDAERAARRIAEAYQHGMAFFQQASYILLVAAGAFLVTRGEMTMGALIACTILSGRVLNPMALVASQLVQWSQTRAALEALDHVWRLEDDHHGHEPVLLEGLRGHYRLEQVQARHGDTLALAVPRLEIRAGERIGVIGPVGAGKTTLLRLLSGMYKPQDGRVLLDDVDLAHVAKPVLAERVGYLQQEGRLFAGTLRENLILGLVDPGDEAILAAARATGLLQAVIASNPRGLHQPIHEGGTGLSGGQRQLVNLTRVLLRRPQVWLLDEPTASVDGQSEREILDLLQRELTPGHTLVLVTHKPEMLQLVDRLIVIAAHQIVADGPTAQVLARLQAPAPVAPSVQKVAA